MLNQEAQEVLWGFLECENVVLDDELHRCRRSKEPLSTIDPKIGDTIETLEHILMAPEIWTADKELTFENRPCSPIKFTNSKTNDVLAI